MARSILAGVLCVTVLAGCSTLGSSGRPATPETAAAPAPAAGDGAELARLVERRVGDYAVHLVSGTFRPQSALFSERVIGREGDLWIIEYRLETQNATSPDAPVVERLRTFVDPNGAVVRVLRVGDQGETPATLADYETFMAAATLVPDENQGLTATSRGTCTLGPSELDCETKSYRVRLGDHEASLGITQSPAVRGTDLAGEITAADGTVIFRSQLLEHGNGAPAVDSSVALSRPAD